LSSKFKEYIKYPIIFLILIGLAFGSIQVLKSILNTKYPVMVVVSQSMVPTLGVGDFIVVNNVNDFEEVEAAPKPSGDILVFLRSRSSDEYIVHRAIDKFYRDGEWWFITKGDHNLVADSQPVQESKVVGKLIGKIPLFGYFPLFIKTSRGFAVVAGLMGIIFFADYIMPNKTTEETEGKLPIIAIIPFIATPLVFISFWFSNSYHFELELISLIFWYVGSIIAPFAFGDDDMGLMFWLYHFVLSVIPIGCDIIWRTTGITPSMWWYVEGSTVPITWLLQKETPMFFKAFNMFAIMLLPGCTVFLILMALKRRGTPTLVSFSKWMRNSEN
jgi:signal peptidase